MGYNVYRDGVLVKKLDSKTTTWTDDNYANDNGYGAGNHKYNVIVVYANGESDVSNTAYVGDPAAGIGLVTVEGSKGRQPRIHRRRTVRRQEPPEPQQGSLHPERQEGCSEVICKK